MAYRVQINNMNPLDGGSSASNDAGSNPGLSAGRDTHMVSSSSDINKPSHYMTFYDTVHQGQFIQLTSTGQNGEEAVTNKLPLSATEAASKAQVALLGENPLQLGENIGTEPAFAPAEKPMTQTAGGREQVQGENVGEGGGSGPEVSVASAAQPGSSGTNAASASPTPTTSTFDGGASLAQTLSEADEDATSDEQEAAALGDGAAVEPTVLDQTVTAVDRPPNPLEIDREVIFENFNKAPESFFLAPSVAVFAATGDESEQVDLAIQVEGKSVNVQENLSVIISGVPEGGTLSAGVDNGDGTWTLQLSDLGNLQFTPPVGEGDYDLSVTAVATNGGQTISSSAQTLNVDISAAGVTLSGGSSNETLKGNQWSDEVNAGGGNDKIYGYAGEDTLHGGAGKDVIYGGDHGDVLFGDAGNDTVRGDAGDDTVSGGAGADKVYGGTGDDTASGGEGNDRVYGDAGNDTVSGGAGADRVYGGTGDDTASGGEGNDFVYGQNGNDILSGGAGIDKLYGGSGDDTFLYNAATDSKDTFSGGSGHDIIANTSAAAMEFKTFSKNSSIEEINANNQDIQGTSTNNSLDFSNTTLTDVGDIRGQGGNDTIKGSDDADTVYGDSGNDKLYGNDGDDTIYGGTGADRVYGGAGDDTIAGDEGNDRLYAGEGADLITGGIGNDMIYGQDGDDTITGGQGVDKLYGGAGDDTFNYDAATDSSDTFSGGSGDDTLVNVGESDLQFTNFKSNYSIEEIKADGYEIHGTSGKNTLDFSNTDLTDAGAIRGLGGHDTIKGSSGDNTIYGDSGNDKLYGNAGDDTMFGGVGNDKMYGGTGDDTFDGGAGNDKFYGQAGNDTFVFGENQGTDTASGGAGGEWTDKVSLQGVSGGPGEGDWVLNTSASYTIDQANKTITFDNGDASGSITMDDGSKLNFSQMEEIHWG